MPLGFVLNAAGDAVQLIGNLATAASRLVEALAQAVAGAADMDVYSVTISMHELGQVYLAQGKLSKAASMLEESLAM